MISADRKARQEPRQAANNIAMLAAPTISVGTCVCGSLAKISSSCGMMRSDSTEKPSSLPICPRQILIAMPFKKSDKDWSGQEVRHRPESKKTCYDTEQAGQKCNRDRKRPIQLGISAR